MLVDEMVEIKLSKRNKEHYKLLGYEFTDSLSKLKVKSKHLTKGTHLVVKVICDYCNEEYSTQYSNYYRYHQKEGLNKDSCKKCSPKKTEELTLIRHGVKNVMQLESNKNKLKNTMIERYGVENYSQTDEWENKMKMTSYQLYGVDSYSKTQEYKDRVVETNKDKYGADYYAQTKEFKDRVSETNLGKYGVYNVFQAEEIKKKIKEFNINTYGVEYYSQTSEYKERVSNKWRQFKIDGTLESILRKRIETSLSTYGTEYPIQHPSVAIKVVKSLDKNGSVPTSKQQVKIHSLIGGVLNKRVGRYFLDVAFEEDKIYVEYDGGGHDLSVKLNQVTREEFELKEAIRTKYLEDKQWGEIRIISDTDNLPSDSTILDFVEIAKSFIIADKWFSAHWNIDEDFVKVNYKHTYYLNEFFDKFNKKEAI